MFYLPNGMIAKNLLTSIALLGLVNSCTKVVNSNMVLNQEKECESVVIDLLVIYRRQD